MRERLIKPDFSKDEDVPLLSRDARLLFILLWMHVDRDGRCEDKPIKIRGDLFPHESHLDVEPWLQELATTQKQVGEGTFIIRYQVGGKRYIQIPKFMRHQRFHPKERFTILPGPPSSLMQEQPASNRPDTGLQSASNLPASGEPSASKPGPSGPSGPSDITPPLYPPASAGGYPPDQPDHEPPVAEDRPLTKAEVTAAVERLAFKGAAAFGRALTRKGMRAIRDALRGGATEAEVGEQLEREAAEEAAAREAARPDPGYVERVQAGMREARDEGRRERERIQREMRGEVTDEPGVAAEADRSGSGGPSASEESGLDRQRGAEETGHGRVVGGEPDHAGGPGGAAPAEPAAEPAPRGADTAGGVPAAPEAHEPASALVVAPDVEAVPAVDAAPRDLAGEGEVTDGAHELAARGGQDQAADLVASPVVEADPMAGSPAVAPAEGVQAGSESHPPVREADVPAGEGEVTDERHADEPLAGGGAREVQAPSEEGEPPRGAPAAEVDSWNAPPELRALIDADVDEIFGPERNEGASPDDWEPIVVRSASLGAAPAESLIEAPALPGSNLPPEPPSNAGARARVPTPNGNDPVHEVQRYDNPIEREVATFLKSFPGIGLEAARDMWPDWARGGGVLDRDQIKRAGPELQRALLMRVGEPVASREPGEDG